MLKQKEREIYAVTIKFSYIQFTQIIYGKFHVSVIFVYIIKIYHIKQIKIVTKDISIYCVHAKVLAVYGDVNFQLLSPMALVSETFTYPAYKCTVFLILPHL